MSTFFINLSKGKSFEDSHYKAFYDIQGQEQSLIMLSCPIENWLKEDGFVSIAKKINSKIDSHIEVHTTFSLIFFVDLTEEPEYSALLKEGEENESTRKACCEALHSLYTHFLCNTLLAELEQAGRAPREVRIMYGENEPNVRGGEVVANQETVKENILRFLGIPSKESIKKHTEEQSEHTPVKMGITREWIRQNDQKYRREIEIWEKDIVEQSAPRDIYEIYRVLTDKISQINNGEKQRFQVKEEICTFDYSAYLRTSDAKALYALNLLFYVLKCAETERRGQANAADIVYERRNAEQIGKLLAAKRRQYKDKLDELSTDKSYMELGLVPPLPKLDRGRLGLDDQGGDKSLTDSKSEGAGATGRVDSLFTEEEYPLFNNGRDTDNAVIEIEEDAKGISKQHIADAYKKKSEDLSKKHVSFLKRLGKHVAKVLSHYAGKSKTNTPAVLQPGGYRNVVNHGNPGDGGEIELVEKEAEDAYATVYQRYIGFCSARRVSVTDIEEQRKWFDSEVDKIAASLKRTKIIAIGMFLSVFVLYVPFMSIQHNAFSRSIGSFVVALSSFIAPFLLLGFAIGYAVKKQKKKYALRWAELVEKSDELLKDNNEAADQFDELLARTIPSLRWVYEYKLEVDYCNECCGLADAKIKHHKDMLVERLDSIKYFLNALNLDLSAVGAAAPVGGDRGVVEYNKPYCAEGDNREFYMLAEKIL